MVLVMYILYFYGRNCDANEYWPIFNVRKHQEKWAISSSLSLMVSLVLLLFKGCVSIDYAVGLALRGINSYQSFIRNLIRLPCLDCSPNQIKVIDSALWVRSVSISSILIIVISSVLAINRALEGIVYASFHAFPSEIFRIYQSVRSRCPGGPINGTDSKMNMQFNKQWMIKILQSGVISRFSSIEESVHSARGTYSISTYQCSVFFSLFFFQTFSLILLFFVFISS